jgi:GntR family transcriptional regulator / MocR family aminotransferase
MQSKITVYWLFIESHFNKFYGANFMGKITPQILLTSISITKKAEKPLQNQLYDQLKSAIYEGMLRRGDRLPSSREMSAELKISRNTVLQVFEQMKMEGYFESRTGAGTYISSNTNNFSFTKIRSTRPVQKQERHIANPDGLNNSFKGHFTALEAIRPFQQSIPLIPEFPFATWARISTSILKKPSSLHLGYDDAQGYLPLRKALADHLRISRSINCEPENILIVNGSRQALHLAAEILLKQGDQCLMEDPGYPGAKSAMHRFGGQVCPVPITSDGIDLDYAIKHYPKAKLCYVTPSHQFPMGNTMPINARIKLLNWAKENQMWIIEDDYDSEFRYNGRPVPALQGLDTNGNVIYSGTFSKVLLPALRLGYMVFPSNAMARIFAVGKSVIDGQSNAFNQAIVSEFIRQGHFSRHIRRMRLLYKKAQDDLLGLIGLHLKNKLTPVPVQAGMHLLAWLPPSANAELVANEAQKEGLIIHPLSQYSIRCNHPNGLTLGFSGFSYPEMETSIIKLKRLLNRIL